mmetsp:Transcript_97500/g.135524  ORF Transcript_97500/g.135524 Transcript_97500/m.135524 type:complete len:89 (-) Transcript_97500:130-396(-)
MIRPKIDKFSSELRSGKENPSVIKEAASWIWCSMSALPIPSLSFSRGMYRNLLRWFDMPSTSSPYVGINELSFQPVLMQTEPKGKKVE